MDVGFVVLCPDGNIGGIKNTLGSIRFNSYDRESICVVSEDCDTKDFNKLVRTYKAGNTITSLINVGMNNLEHDWACVLFGGSRIPAYMEKKIELWAREETDVVFPVVDRKWEFSEASFNGVLLNTKFFAKVGDFPTTTMMKAGLNDFELAKLFWAIKAIELNCQFRAIVGMRII